MIQVHRFMPAALADVLRKAPLTDAKVEFAWRSAVGPAMHRGTRIAFANGVLRVAADSVAWRREVERSAALIRARLDALLGHGVIRAIDVCAPQTTHVQND